MQSQDPNVGIIKEIRDCIQFLMTVQIFFAAFVYTYFKTIGSNDLISNTNSLFWGFGVAFCIMNYLWVGMADEVRAKLLDWVRFLISLNIACFVLPIIIFLATVKAPVSGFPVLLFYISFEGCIWIPMATFVILMGILYWEGFRVILENWSKIVERIHGRGKSTK